MAAVPSSDVRQYPPPRRSPAGRSVASAAGDAPTCSTQMPSVLGDARDQCHNPYESHFPSGIGGPILYEKNTTFMRSGDALQVNEN
jgi:hypothetical protein